MTYLMCYSLKSTEDGKEIEILHKKIIHREPMFDALSLGSIDYYKGN
jgi:hypothetical protein